MTQHFSTLLTTWNPTCLQILIVIGCIQTAHVLDQDTNSHYLKSNGITRTISPPKGRQARFKVNRVRRTLPTSAEQQQYLDEHNRLRRLEGASNMALMSWDDDLAEMASLWAEHCHWEHGQPNYANPPYDPIGQNLYITSSSTLNIENALQSWYNEIEFYNFNDDSCETGQVCGHYTQVVWDDSDALGCAHATCSSVEGLSSQYDGGTYVVCNYGPAGNYDRSPYSRGDVCTQCSSGVFWCDDGLCTDSCPASTSDCVCAANCRNCGVTVSNTCSCNCTRGWTGVDCSTECVDTNANCGANPGWPTSWCTTQYQYVLDGCPLMCGLCEAASADDVCDDDTSLDETQVDEDTENAATSQHTLNTIVIIVITCSVARLVQNIVF